MRVDLKLTEVSWVAVESKNSLKSFGSISSSGTGNIGDNVVREILEGVGDPGARIDVSVLDDNGLSGVVFTVEVVELECVSSSEIGSLIRLDGDGGSSHTGGSVINVKRIDSNLACPGGAISSGVTRVAFAPHSFVGVPEGVNVLEVVKGKLGDGFASAVAGAAVGARCTLAGVSVVAIEALALARVAVADALVGALHVVMRSVGKCISSWVVHNGVLFGGSGGVDSRGGNHRSGGDSRGMIEITFGSIDVS
jgi:hypothetical protein